jgi:hypothetical protein
MKKQSITLVFCFIILAMVVSCKKTETEPDVLKVLTLTEKIGNYGYEELAVATSKWIYSMPLDKKSPLNDPDGTFHATALQPIPAITVLMGTADGNSSRNMSIPSGNYVFLPIIFANYWHYENDKCDPTFQPAQGQTLEAFLLENAAASIGEVTSMTAQLDGKEIVADLKKYQIKTKSFSSLIAADFNNPNCDYSKQNATMVADGYFLLLKLPKGKHTITYNSVIPNVVHPPDTWNLTVE